MLVLCAGENRDNPGEEAMAAHTNDHCWSILSRTNRQAGMIPGLRTYPVNPKAREPLVRFMTGALMEAGCSIIHSTSPDRAPFVIVFETPTGERIGLVAYA